MKLLKKFFKQIYVYEIFSELEQNFVVLWQQHFTRLSKMRFICLEDFFMEILLPGKFKAIG